MKSQVVYVGYDVHRLYCHPNIAYYLSSHCKENPIYVFPEKKLPGLSPNFYIHVSVNDLCIPTILHLF
jgi:hypothetical protein